MRPNREFANFDDPVDILAIDDHEENLIALRAILDRPDYRLITATSGQEALKILLKQDFALILLDVMMPEMDGYDLATRIKERESDRNIPIIFLTAIARDIEHVFRGYSVGAVDYLLKPLVPEVVRAKVEVFANLRRQAREIARQAEILAEKERQEKEHQLTQLKESEERRFQALADSIPQFVWTADPDGNVQYCNEKGLLYTGFTLQQIISNWTDALHVEDRDRTVATWRESIKSGKIFEVEFRMRRNSDRAFRWFLGRAVPTRNSQGEILEWFGTCTDIELQKKTEMELQDTIQARDDFLSIAAHELKTPLSSLALGLETLVRKLRKETKNLIPSGMVITKLEESLVRVARLGRLVENLLDISRIRSGRLIVERENLDFAMLIQDIVEKFKIQAHKAHIPMTLTISENPMEGEFDRVRVEQVVTNLLSNAIKYGNGKPVEISLTADNQTITLVVRDEGIGIGKDDQERIFGRFERAITHREISGMGLGLWVSQQIVKAHGGTILVHSDLNRGATFQVQLPRHAAQEDAVA